MQAKDAPPCTVCGGTGIIRVDELNSNRCECAVFKRLRGILGPELVSAVSNVHTPLFQPGRDNTDWDHPAVDLTSHNMRLLAPWGDFITHLKWVLLGKLGKDLQYRHLVVTDERIKSVYVGNEQAAKKNREDRETNRSYEGLSNLISDYDLVILRLGFIGHKNRAAAGALKEGLMIREAALRPTWIVEDPAEPFIPTYAAYSDELAGYINTHFEPLDLQSTQADGRVQELPSEAPAPIAPQAVRQLEEVRSSADLADVIARLGDSPELAEKKDTYGGKKHRKFR